MTYPHKNRTRVTNPETIPFRPLGLDAGQRVSGQASNAIADMSTATTYTVNLPSGEYGLGLAASHGAQTMVASITLKVNPYINAGQTLQGNALSMRVLGTATLVTAITLGATSVAAGSIAQVIAGKTAGEESQVPLPYGCAVNVNIGTNAVGDLDFTLLAQQRQ